MALIESKDRSIETTGGDQKNQPKYRVTPRYSAWFEEQKFIIQVVLPGVKKENLQIKALKDLISLRAQRGEILYSLDVDLNCEVKPSEAKTSYFEGLLKMEFPLLDPLEEAYTVPIE